MKPTTDFPLFPRCLYGGAVSTRAAWRRILNRAWEAGCWDDVFSELEMVSVNDFPGWIILDDDPGLTVRRQPHWRLLWVSKLWSCRFANEGGYSTIQKMRRLTIAGMEQFWFALAMFDVHDRVPAFFAPDIPDFENAFARPMLRYYLYWLPEILKLMPRLAHGIIVPVPYQDRYNPHTWWHIWRNLLVFLNACGYSKFSTEIVEEITTRYDKDVVRWLLDKNIIEPIGNRYRLRE